MKRYQSKNNKRQVSMIQKQADEIRDLKNKINTLQIENERKDELIHLVDTLTTDLQNEIEEIYNLKERYRVLINDLNLMMQIFNTKIFKGRWKLIRLLMK